MPAYPENVIVILSERFHVERGFLAQCIEESVVQIQEVAGEWDLSDGTALRLRRLERLCRTFEIDVPIAKRILELTERVALLEEQLRRRDIDREEI
jgi:hypothetical protein